jgi:hypothetical protein
MKRLIGNFYWTKNGLGYRVDSQAKANRYNKILGLSSLLVVLAILGLLAVLLGFGDLNNLTDVQE